MYGTRKPRKNLTQMYQFLPNIYFRVPDLIQILQFIGMDRYGTEKLCTKATAMRSSGNKESQAVLLKRKFHFTHLGAFTFGLNLEDRY